MFNSEAGIKKMELLWIVFMQHTLSPESLISVIDNKNY